MNIQGILQSNENTLLIVRRDDLLEFAVAYADRILTKEQEPQVAKEEKPLTQTEAIKFLGRSRQTLICWRKKGLISAYRLGGRIYYKPSELISALHKLGK